MLRSHGNPEEMLYDKQRERLCALQAVDQLFLRYRNTVCQIINTCKESKGCIILEQRRKNAEDDGNVSAPRQ